MTFLLLLQVDERVHKFTGDFPSIPHRDFDLKDTFDLFGFGYRDKFHTGHAGIVPVVTKISVLEPKICRKQFKATHKHTIDFSVCTIIENPLTEPVNKCMKN